MENNTQPRLLILNDLTKLTEREDGFIIARKDIRLLDETVDLGFDHSGKPFDKLPFQSIPIVIYPLRKPDLEMLKDLFYCSVSSGRTMILARREDETDFKLYLRSNKSIAMRMFYHQNSAEMKDKIVNFQETLNSITREYQAAYAAARGE